MAEAIYNDINMLNEITWLEKDKIKVLKICFGVFDVKKQDFYFKNAETNLHQLFFT